MNTIIKTIIAFFYYHHDSKMLNKTISGTITDNQNQPLEFANVILHNSETKAVITGVISIENGTFSFSDVENNSYYIEVSMLGFKTKTF